MLVHLFFLVFPVLIGKLLMKSCNLRLTEVAVKYTVRCVLPNFMSAHNLYIDDATESKVHFKTYVYLLWEQKITR